MSTALRRFATSRRHKQQQYNINKNEIQNLKKPIQITHIVDYDSTYPRSSFKSLKKKHHSLPPKLPSNKITEAQYKSLARIYHTRKSNNLFKLFPLKPIQSLKTSRNVSCSQKIQMPSQHLKPNEKYVAQYENIRLVENILSMKPRVQLTKKNHNQFYKQQLRYKKIIQTSRSSHLSKNTIMAHSKSWE